MSDSDDDYFPKMSGDNKDQWVNPAGSTINSGLIVDLIEAANDLPSGNAGSDVTNGAYENEKIVTILDPNESIKRAKLEVQPVTIDESTILQTLPNAQSYQTSYMHKSKCTKILVSKEYGRIITFSDDGHIKFWNKQDGEDIVFISDFKAHHGLVNDAALNYNGQWMATIGPDDHDGATLKIFDVMTFDMVHVHKLAFRPLSCEFISDFKGDNPNQNCICISSNDTPDIHIFNVLNAIYYDNEQSVELVPIKTISDLHYSPVHLMKYNAKDQVMISVDTKGMIEYWSGIDYLFPEKAVDFKFKTDGTTDLYEFLLKSTFPLSLQLSPSSYQNNIIARDNVAQITRPSMQSVQMLFLGHDRVVRIFDFATGKLIITIDESLDNQAEAQRSHLWLESIDFGRQYSIDKELQSKESEYMYCNAIFDESGTFIFYGTLFGIKLVSIANYKSPKFIEFIGKNESSMRFMNLALIPSNSSGKEEVKNLLSMELLTSSNLAIQKKLEAVNSILFCTAYLKNRFYLFTRTERPEDGAGRDVFNEKPSREEMLLSQSVSESSRQRNEKSMSQNNPKRSNTGTASNNSKANLIDSRVRLFDETKLRQLDRDTITAIIHTTMGDIRIEVFAKLVPKAASNFLIHSIQGYYNGLIFHRVIKSFMVQTGDPLGDGTGGESIFGKPFADEFVPSLTHSQPYTISMANNGPNANESQFFITTVPANWLDNKHTVFAKIISGFDTALAISNVKTNKYDKPLKDVFITSITVL